MGNAVSAAEIAEITAAQLINPNESPRVSKIHKDFKNYSGEIPPECPMHKSKAPVESGCPVQSGKGDINPLNMVTVIFCQIVFIVKNIPVTLLK